MKEILGRIVAAELEERRKQGYDVEALRPLLGKASGSCDALLALSQRIKEAPIRQDWPYEEPDDLESVMAACDPTRRREASRLLSDGEIEARVRSAFLTSVCACILGKPLEEAPYGGLEDIRARRAGKRRNGLAGLCERCDAYGVGEAEPILGGNDQRKSALCRVR